MLVIVLFPLLFIIFAIMGWLLLARVPGLEFTKWNLFVFMIGAIVGAWVFSVFLVLVLVALKINPPIQDMNSIVLVAWFVGGASGGTALAWVKIRYQREVASREKRRTKE
ncbi:MAG TPA: hypothetical protein VI431_11620 [Candidatus Acidoferrum sp.]